MAKSYIDNADKPVKKDEEKCRFDLGEYVLLLMALLFLTKNQNIAHRLKSKVLEFLNAIDETQYSDNQDIVWRVSLARSIGRVTMQGARTLPAVEHRVLEDTEWADYHTAFFDAYREDIGHSAEGYTIGNELSDEDAAYLDSYVSTRLRYSYLWKYKSFMREVADRIDAGDMGDIPIFNDRVMTVMERLVQVGRNAKSLSSQEGQDFTTGENSFEAAIRATHAARNRPQSVVKTGMRLLNDMLGGGYEGSRVYVHMGRSGDWKSGMLCSAAFWACDPRFNPSFETRDPTRKPCVILLTQENDVYETIERMISFSLGSHVDMRGADVNEIVRLMENAFSSESCKFVFKYRQSRSISTLDIEGMIQDLYLQGYEVIMVVQDYIKRMKAIENFRDQRHLELGAIVDEFSALAKRHNIPFVTGMQLNREAYSKFDAAIKSGKLDAVKEIGTSNVGESINVYENADCVIFQGRVVSEATENLYLTMRRAKMRGKRKNGLDFFAQPFARDADGDINEMKVEEDAHLPIKQCRGMRDMTEGIGRDYDANAQGANDDEEDDAQIPAGGYSREEKSRSRSGALLGGNTGKRHNPPVRRNIPEDSGAATLEHEALPMDDNTLQIGLNDL
jgi:hypothetical protein